MRFQHAYVDVIFHIVNEKAVIAVNLIQEKVLDNISLLIATF